MKLILQTILLILCVRLIQSNYYDQLKDGVLNILSNSLGILEPSRDHVKEQKEASGSQTLGPKEAIVKGVPESEKSDSGNIHLKRYSRISSKNEENRINRGIFMNFRSNPVDNTDVQDNFPRDKREEYRLDPAMNLPGPFRRVNKIITEEFLKLWSKNKEEAQREHKLEPDGDGDNVNMVAARPWDVKCGDPNQHDQPWGTCMHPAECEPEDRIYRGDYFCGNTQFICCAVQAQTYDMYQGDPFSFEDKSLSTNEEERKNSREKKKDKKDRKQRRQKRKKKIQSTIKKIIRNIRDILQKSSRNSTKMIRKKTKVLSKFVKELKKEYKKNRISILEIHDEQMMNVDQKLMKKLREIEAVNKAFMTNATFRDIIVNGTINAKGARMLIEAYPDLVEFINLRRSGGGEPARSADSSNNDIEYGYLYY